MQRSPRQIWKTGFSATVAVGFFTFMIIIFAFRWVLFANSSFEFLHESILSYQCICRNQTIIYEVKDWMIKSISEKYTLCLILSGSWNGAPLTKFDKTPKMKIFYENMSKGQAWNLNKSLRHLEPLCVMGSRTEFRVCWEQRPTLGRNASRTTLFGCPEIGQG